MSTFRNRLLEFPYASVENRQNEHFECFKQVFRFTAMCCTNEFYSFIVRMIAICRLVLQCRGNLEYLPLGCLEILIATSVRAKGAT